MTLRALIVDDNATLLATARRMLEGEGIAVVGVASTGAEALVVSEEQGPDVILVNVDLGEESCFDLAERLDATTGSRPSVVLISAYAEEDLEDLLMGSSAIGFVAKTELSTEAIIDVLGRSIRVDHTPSA